MKKFKPVLFSLLGTFLSAAALVFWRLRKQEGESSTAIPEDIKAGQSMARKSGIYKTAGLKKVEVKDVQNNVLIDNTEFFTGTANVRPDEHDKYNVDILDENGNKIGHIEKNHRLSNSLTEWHNGIVFIFGKIQNSDNTNTRRGLAFIPAGLKKSRINDLKLAFDKLKKQENTLAKAAISSNEYLEILDNHNFISTILSQFDIADEINISLSKKIIPTLSKQLEEEENWDGLLLLEKHSKLIDEQSERFAGTTYRRIGKAKKFKGQKQ